MLAKGCAICLVLLVISPVTAPFRTLDDLTWCATSHTAVSAPADSDPASVEDATLTNDPVLAKSIRLGGVIPLAAASSGFIAPLSDASSQRARASGRLTGRSRVSPVLRV